MHPIVYVNKGFKCKWFYVMILDKKWMKGKKKENDCMNTWKDLNCFLAIWNVVRCYQSKWAWTTISYGPPRKAHSSALFIELCPYIRRGFTCGHESGVEIFVIANPYTQDIIVCRPFKKLKKNNVYNMCECFTCALWCFHNEKSFQLQLLYNVSTYWVFDSPFVFYVLKTTQMMAGESRVRSFHLEED